MIGKLIFLLTKKSTISSPGFLGQQFNTLQWAALLTSFCRHWFNMTKLLTSLAQYDKVLSKFNGQQQLVMHVVFTSQKQGNILYE